MQSFKECFESLSLFFYSINSYFESYKKNDVFNSVELIFRLDNGVKIRSKQIFNFSRRVLRVVLQLLTLVLQVGIYKNN